MVATLAESVSASAEPSARGRWIEANHDSKSPDSMTIPSVDAAERKNDTETAVSGETAIIETMQSPIAATDDFRLRAKNDESPASAMIEARIADTGAAARSR